MEKEVLTKIYLLRKVKPNASFVERAKENILQRDVVLVKEESVISELTGSLLNVFANSVFQSRMAVVGAFMFLLFFGVLAYPLLPLNYEYNFVYIPTLEERINEEGVKMVAETDEMMVDVATSKKPIRKDLAVLEEASNLVDNLARKVLGSMIPEEEKVAVNLTDKDIVDYYLTKIEDPGLRKELKEVSEREDYSRAFNMIVDFLAEQE